MDSSRDSEFDARLKRIEAVLTDLQRSIDAVTAERRPAPPHERASEAPASSPASAYPAPPIAPARRRQATPTPIDRGVSSLFASHEPEWWLSRVGIGFLILGVLLLYGYAVDHGWITPTLRVLAGITVGGLLFWAAGRVRSPTKASPNTDLGFRELLLGGALAIWYVTAYAAGVWYQLIPLPAVRLVLFLLAILTTWIALQENREIFALAAVATGFATPFILPAPVHSMTELSLYLGAITAIGLIIYLMRGWQSTLWITFVAFWLSVAQTANAQTIAPPRLLDAFDSVSEWSASPAAGVDITIHRDSSGVHGPAMRLDFDFHGHGGYAVVHRLLYLPLPSNYEFSFAIRGDAPTNTLELKLIDSTGANVWWSNNPGFQFPPAWTTITRNKRQIPFAWGQPRDYELKRVAAIEFAITAGSGGKGSVWLDDLAITPIAAPAVGSVVSGPIVAAPGRAYAVAHRTSPALGSVALSILLLAAAVAFTRAPMLRRQLLKVGSPRYTATPVTSGTKKFIEALDSLAAALGGGKSSVDSLIVWVLMLVSSVLAMILLGAIWPRVPDEIWGAALVWLGLGAFIYSRRRAQADAEISHVAYTAGVFWTLIGVAKLAPTPESIPACALVAALVINFAPRKFAGPRTLAKLTIALALMAIAGYELSSDDTGLVHVRWVLSEVVALGAAAFIARRLIADAAEETQGMFLGAASYLTGLIVVWSTLNPIWPPLVTTSYAILGALLLILSRRESARPLLKYLGGATMVIVVGRLLLIDLASVETIWRVLLFLLCGVVFLYTAYQMQGVARRRV